jgi:hypothetical protein
MKEVMNRRAADNAYLHKDFHAALSTALIYLEATYGADAVREYLRQFAAAFYGGLKKDVQQRGLIALQEHYAHIYEIEQGDVSFDLRSDALTMQVAACPAVMHMRTNGRPVSPLFYETTKTVNETICDGTPFQAELVAYDEQTGRSTVRFSRRQP